MRVQRILWLTSALHFLPASAADGPIDFTKAPGGGPSSQLRRCAQYAYDPNSRAGSVWDLGCQKISCLCRNDLIQKAYDLIKGAVVANCGEDSGVDLEQANKVYNDYCSANGFDIPGYTYIVTVTVPPPTETSQLDTPRSTDEAADPTSVGPAAGSAGPTTSPGVTAVATTGIQNMPTAVVTITVKDSSGTKRKPWLIFQLLYMVPSLSVRYIYACAESIITTYTSPPPLPAISSVVTIFKSVPRGSPAVSTAIEYAEPSSARKTYTTYVVSNQGPSDSADPTTRTENDASKSGDGEKGLTKLEIVGIVIGIITALATTAATIWMCARGHKLRPKEPSPPSSRVAESYALS